jgi:hypothetical protein
MCFDAIPKERTVQGRAFARLEGFHNNDMRGRMSPFRKLSVIIAAAACALAGAACNPAQNTADANLAAPNLAVPAGGITAVKDVIVTPRENDQLELTAAANGTFKFEQLQAVLWCRASRYVKENKLHGWQVVKVEQLRPATAESPMVGRGLIVLAKTPAAAAAAPKQPVKDWCKEAPKIAAS